MPNVLPIALLNNTLPESRVVNRTNQSDDFATTLKNAKQALFPHTVEDFDKKTNYLKNQNLEFPIQHNKEKDKARLKEVSYELEAIFINLLLKQMRISIHKTPLFHGGYAEEIFEDMLYDEYAKLIAKSDHFGIAKQIYEQLSSP